MFHWRDHTYFGRCEDGAVRVVRFSGPPHVQWWHNEQSHTVPTNDPRPDGEFRSVQVLLDIRITPEEWASIVSSVSREGEGNGRYYEALKWHQGGNTVGKLSNDR